MRTRILILGILALVVGVLGYLVFFDESVDYSAETVRQTQSGGFDVATTTATTSVTIERATTSTKISSVVLDRPTKTQYYRYEEIRLFGKNLVPSSRSQYSEDPGQVLTIKQKSSGNVGYLWLVPREHLLDTEVLISLPWQVCSTIIDVAGGEPCHAPAFTLIPGEYELSLTPYGKPESNSVTIMILPRTFTWVTKIEEEIGVSYQVPDNLLELIRDAGAGAIPELSRMPVIGFTATDPDYFSCTPDRNFVQGQKISLGGRTFCKKIESDCGMGHCGSYYRYSLPMRNGYVVLKLGVYYGNRFPSYDRAKIDELFDSIAGSLQSI